MMFVPRLSKANQKKVHGWWHVESIRISDLPLLVACVYKKVVPGRCGNRSIDVDIYKVVVVKLPRYGVVSDPIHPVVYETSEHCGKHRAMDEAEQHCL